jgi:hypothetical protein
MQLPCIVSEEQWIRLRCYGREHCDEIRLLQLETSAIFAGILRKSFKSKKVSQTSFGLNLKSWGIPRIKYMRGWYCELSLREYLKEFSNCPPVYGRRMLYLMSCRASPGGKRAGV